MSQSVCPINLALCQSFLKDTVTEKEHEELLELKKNVTQLYLTGDNTVSTVCASILGKTLGHTNVQSSVTTCFKDHEDSEIPVKASRIRFGRKRFVSAKCQFNNFCKGYPVPKRKYGSRLRPQCIASAIQYIEEVCPIVAGKSRNVKIDGNVLSNLPVYSRGGKSFSSIFKEHLLG